MQCALPLSQAAHLLHISGGKVRAGITHSAQVVADSARFSSAPLLTLVVDVVVVAVAIADF